MEIKKAQWATDGNNIRLTLSLTKIDQENRIVSGWASLDNIDSQGDVILAEANANAFSDFRGNIREMHQPIAVGRMVNFREDAYYDPATNSMYNGIFVDVYVSKGAQDTWEKVLDGTLSGFSIGGEILDSETTFVGGETIRIIKSYQLVELSLVDNPANQLANVFSITKSADGPVLKGMLADAQVENVFYCTNDEIVKASTDESVTCANCGSAMTNIGWIEHDGTDKTEKIREVVAAYSTNSTNSVEEDSAEIAKQGEPANNEGGVDVAEETETVETDEATEEVVTEVDESVDAEAGVADEEEAAEAVAEEAADVSEVEAEEPDFAKMFGDLQAAIESGLAKTSEEAQEAISKATEAFDNKFAELAGKHEELTKSVETLKETLGNVEKSVKVLESETAVKKSGDLGGSTEETLTKSKGPKWGGRFLGLSDLQD